MCGSAAGPAVDRLRPVVAGRAHSAEPHNDHSPARLSGALLHRRGLHRAGSARHQIVLDGGRRPVEPGLRLRRFEYANQLQRGRQVLEDATPRFGSPSAGAAPRPAPARDRRSTGPRGGCAAGSCRRGRPPSGRTPAGAGVRTSSGSSSRTEANWPTRAARCERSATAAACSRSSALTGAATAVREEPRARSSSASRGISVGTAARRRALRTARDQGPFPADGACCPGRSSSGLRSAGLRGGIGVDAKARGPVHRAGTASQRRHIS